LSQKYFKLANDFSYTIIVIVKFG